MSDWNGDGLHDSYDEAHEFGIDLDGGGSVTDAVADDDFGGMFDLAWIDLADIVGAPVTDGLGLDDPGDATGAAAGLAAAAAARAVALPRGDAFYEALGQPAAAADVRAWVAGLTLANPFGTDPAEPDPADPPRPEGTAPDTAV